jgi:hypothetical protein
LCLNVHNRLPIFLMTVISETRDAHTKLENLCFYYNTDRFVSEFK